MAFDSRHLTVDIWQWQKEGKRRKIIKKLGNKIEENIEKKEEGQEREGECKIKGWHSTAELGNKIEENVEKKEEDQEREVECKIMEKKIFLRNLAFGSWHMTADSWHMTVDIWLFTVVIWQWQLVYHIW